MKPETKERLEMLFIWLLVVFAVWGFVAGYMLPRLGG